MPDATFLDIEESITAMSNRVVRVIDDFQRNPGPGILPYNQSVYHTLNGRTYRVQLTVSEAS